MAETPVVTISIKEFVAAWPDALAVMTEKLWDAGVRDKMVIKPGKHSIAYWVIPGTDRISGPVVADDPRNVCIRAIEDLVQVELVDGRMRRLKWAPSWMVFIPVESPDFDLMGMWKDMLDDLERVSTTKTCGYKQPAQHQCVATARFPEQDRFCVTVQGDEEARRITGHLVVSSVSFKVEPWPDDQYQINVKLEAQGLLTSLLKLKERPPATRNLSLSEISEIYGMFADQCFTTNELADRFKLPKDTVTRILEAGSAMNLSIEVPHDFEC